MASLQSQVKDRDETMARLQSQVEKLTQFVILNQSSESSVNLDELLIAILIGITLKRSCNWSWTVHCDLYYGKVYHTAFDSYDWMTQYADPSFHRHMAGTISDYISRRFVYMLIASLLLGILFWKQGQKINTQQDWLNLLGAMYLAVQLLGVNL
ncbi:hypothetical protein NE237_032474 [Protea cynaroides]|uniref:Uncharacterized protein n=1 Tax=Protea cynaroides TaxID=273540 RepID=A0A9Q0L377_9MAGN|nr:hypothetical protein NE237_032474 [Protea cynaroides]